jgi:TatD DNase family protein
MWFDSHCHISAGDFDADRAKVIERAARSGVEGFIAIGSGYGIAHNARAVELAEQDPRVFATVGVHPHEAQALDASGRSALAALLDHPRVVAVGEAGLDYHYMNSPREVQREVFAEQVATARARAMPISIHARGDEPDAFGEVMDIWRAESGDTVRGLLHCYTGTLEFAKRALDAGFYVSFSGILTFKNDRGLRGVAAALPLDRLMVETDAPLLAPEGFRGQRNEPVHVARVGETLAKIKGLPAKDVARATTHNAREFFGIGAAT